MHMYYDDPKPQIVAYNPQLQDAMPSIIYQFWSFVYISLLVRLDTFLTEMCA